MKKDLGIVKSVSGQRFQAYWIRHKQEVYVRPYFAALQNTPTRIGTARNIAEAQQLLSGFSLGSKTAWM